MRHWFGGGPSDWTMSAVTVSGTADLVQMTGGVPLTMWSTETGNVQQYTDLLDSAGQPAPSILSESTGGTRALGQIPRFQGPDGVVAMWCQAGAGPARFLLVTTDTANVVEDLGTILPPLSVVGPVSAPLTGAGALYVDLSATVQLRSVRASCAPNANPVTVDLFRGGASIFTTPSNRPTIPAGQRSSGLVIPLDMVTLAPGDYLTASLVAGTNVESLTVQATVGRVA